MPPFVYPRLLSIASVAAINADLEEVDAQSNDRRADHSEWVTSQGDMIAASRLRLLVEIDGTENLGASCDNLSASARDSLHCN